MTVGQTQEVRLAMGWNGGVSLAVWMGGVAVELDAARRAFAAPEDDADSPRGVYHALCQAFDCRLVLDIFAGASAGGLNSALLGAAIYRRRRLHPAFVRSKWLDMGDLDGLLQPISKPNPTSIMQGDRFKDALVGAFTELMAPGATPDICALPADQAAVTSHLPILDIQATNVMGRQFGFVDAWGRELVAREYRAPFRFRAAAQFTPENLATASRCSASFPAAFEPAAIEGTALEVAGLSRDGEPFTGGQPESGTPVIRRFAIDGGLLENAPIRQAIELIPSQPASGPVRRFVCYVNAAPSLRVQDAPDPHEPNLRDVVSYVVNLPRIGRDIDQLDAIEDSIRRSAANADTTAALLAVSQDDLLSTATALFEPYRTRRALAGIGDILTVSGRPANPQLVRRVFDATSNGADLPWVPDTLAYAPTGPDWDWGFRAAQRMLFLQLDLLRGAQEAAEAGPTYSEVCEVAYAARADIDDAIASIGAAYTSFLAEPGLETRIASLPTAGAGGAAEALAILAAIYATYQSDDLFDRLHSATVAFYAAVRALVDAGAFPYSTVSLLGHAETDLPPELTDAAFRHFQERALLIEVVRRAFVDDSDADTAQRLEFVQLAPTAATRIFTGEPLSGSGPAAGEEKLTGIRFGHFAGFYRRSWRANDFMWGRLDGAARIADLLVDPDWRRRLDGTEPWATLAPILVPDGEGPAAQDQRILVVEALSDGKHEARDLAPEVVGVLADAEIPDPDRTDALRALVSAAIMADLTAELPATRGFFTRVLVARAAQYEVLRDELPVLVQETTKDRRLGSATRPLAWGLSGSLMPTIADLRDFQGDRALPCRLGRDSGDESSSSLALRTVAHAAAVGLAALPSAGIPLARVTAPLRVPFLSIVGITARSLLANLAALAVFGAAAFYLTARIISSDDTGSHPVLLRDVAALPVLAMGLAALVVIGVVLIPALRAVRSSHHVRNIVWCAALLLSAGAIPIVGGIASIGTARTLTGSGGSSPPEAILVLAFVAAGISYAAQRPISWVVGAIGMIGRGATWVTSGLAIVAAALILVWGAPHVFDALNDGGWHTAGAVAALLSMPILAAYAFVRAWAAAILGE